MSEQILVTEWSGPTPATQQFRIILHVSAQGNLATHLQNKSDESMYYGNYFSNAPSAFTDALKDFIVRAERYKLNIKQP